VHSGQTGAIGRDAHIWKSARCGAPIFVFLLTRSTALYDRERSGPPALLVWIGFVYAALRQSAISRNPSPRECSNNLTLWRVCSNS